MEAALIACSSSGLPVSFASSNSDCALTGKGSAAKVVAQLVPADCIVTASQPGGGAYAAAPEVTERYVVNMLQVSVEVQGPDNRSTPKAGGSAPITVTLKAKGPILLNFVGFTARPDDTVCRPPSPWRSIDTGTSNSISVTFTVALVTPGTCVIEVGASESQFVSGDSAKVQFMVKP
jgi:hypothetical protein